MAASTGRCIFFCKSFSRRLQKDSLKGLFILLIFLASTSSVFLFFYLSSTSKLYNIHPGSGLTRLQINQFSKLNPEVIVGVSLSQQINNHTVISQELVKLPEKIVMHNTSSNIGFQEPAEEVTVIPSPSLNFSRADLEGPWPTGRIEVGSIGKKILSIDFVLKCMFLVTFS